MPQYYYRCEKCEHEFDIRQSIHDEPLTTCPVCPGSVHRVIQNSVGISFKGTGFHKNDYQAKPKTAETPSTPSTPPASATAKE